MLIFKLLNSFLMTILFFSFLIMWLSFNPISMMMCIIFQTILFSTLINYTFIFSWFSYLMYVIFLGGILMLFCYILSISQLSKEPYYKSDNIFFFIFIIMMFSFFLLMKKPVILAYNELKLENMIFLSFSNSFFLMSIFLMTILLFILLIVVFISESSKKKMRSN